MLSNGDFEPYSFDLFGKSLIESPISTINDGEGQITYVSTLLYKLADYFQNHMDFDFKQGYHDLNLEEGYKLFFNQPSRYDLEILEKQLSIGNNLCFLEQSKDPATVFWYLISYLKHMNYTLTHPSFT